MGRNAGDRNVAARLRAPAPARSKRNVPRERRVDHFDDARAIARQPAREGQVVRRMVRAKDGVGRPGEVDDRA
jgi:hypothetical protein